MSENQGWVHLDAACQESGLCGNWRRRPFRQEGELWLMLSAYGEEEGDAKIVLLGAPPS